MKNLKQIEIVLYLSPSILVFINSAVIAQENILKINDQPLPLS